MRVISDDKVVWGVIGAGDVCEKKSAPAMNKIEHSRIQAIMRRDAVKAEDYARRHGIEHWYTDIDSLLSDPEINAIYIATPPDSHLELTQKAAEKGKAVYVEKPMARTYQECLEMIDICKQARVPLFVAYYRRSLPGFTHIKQWIDEGAIGDVRCVNIEMIKPLDSSFVAQSETHWRVNPLIAGGGYFYDLASHQLDFLDFLFGPIVEATGYSANQSNNYLAEDMVTGSFRFENGIMGSGIWCFNASSVSEKETTTIIGTKGKIEFKSFSDYSIILETEDLGRKAYSFEMPEHIQTPLIELVIKELLGNGNCPSTGESGARTNWVLEQIRK
ncbi:MAG: Gfo/Idh/MocA family oxidoreductase [Bacteroidales bacterium]|nr:Gfo/Idh/MocA family oxidoreductase [Bacteroidales bacterium]